MKNKKITIAIIITILLGILTIAGSFALWSVQLGNINVALNTENISNYVEYTEGIAVFDDNIHASNSYSGGKSTIFTLKKKNNPPYPFYASIKLKVNNITNNLRESRAMKWTVTKKASGTSDAETIVAESDFISLIDGDIITLAPAIEATTTKTDYKVYLWADSTDPDVTDMLGEQINVELWMEIYQYRAPSVLEAYCYLVSDGVVLGNGVVKCNIVDSEKGLSAYRISVENQSTSLLSNKYWTSINVNINNALNNMSILIYASDNRIIEREVRQ